MRRPDQPEDNERSPFWSNRRPRNRRWPKKTFVRERAISKYLAAKRKKKKKKQKKKKKKKKKHKKKKKKTKTQETPNHNQQDQPRRQLQRKKKNTPQKRGLPSLEIH